MRVFGDARRGVDFWLRVEEWREQSGWLFIVAW